MTEELKSMKINQGVRDYVRCKIKPWTNKILVEHGNKCIVTGEETVCVHHIIPYIELLKETLLTLNIPYKESYEEYTKEEIDLISVKCLELHYKIGEGAPLKQEIHEIFHSEYGIHNHTKEDFENYIKYITENKDKFYEDHAEKLGIKRSSAFSAEKVFECTEDIENTIQQIKTEMHKRSGVHVDLVKEMFDIIKNYCDLASESLPIQ
jgi:hypothetical protein